MEANSVSCALIITKTLSPTPYMLCDNKQVENGGGCPFLRTPRGFKRTQGSMARTLYGRAAPRKGAPRYGVCYPFTQNSKPCISKP